MIKKVLTIASILALTACGGGGGDSNSTQNPQPDNNSNNTAPIISSQYSSIYMEENSTLSIPLNITNKDNDNLFFEIDTTSQINASVNASQNLIITTGEISEDVKTFITVIVKDEGDLRDDVKFNLNIKDVVKENDQVTIEVSPKNITLLSPKDGAFYPNNIEKNIYYNVISKDTSNNISVTYDIKESDKTGIRNPYLNINKTNESTGFTVSVNSHENYNQDIVDNGYDKTTVDITVSNGIKSNTKSVLITIEELTTATIEERLAKLIEEINSLSSFSTDEEVALIEYMIESLENKEKITFNEKQSLIKELQQVASNIVLSSNSGEITLYKTGGVQGGFARLGVETILTLSQNNGFANLEDLLSVLSSIDLENIERRILLIKQERYKEHAEYFENYIKDIDNKYELDFPKLDLSKRFDAEQGLSLFIGNGEVGHLKGNQWKAFKRYSFLEGVLAKLYNTTEFNISSGGTDSESEEE